MWEYRVIRSVDVTDIEEYSVRKVYYDEDGNILKCSRRPATPEGRSLDSLREDYKRMMEATLKPALDLERFNRRKTAAQRHSVLSFLSR